MVEDVAKCHFCGKGFSSAANCGRHIKGVHQNIRPFKCGVCGQAFKQSGHRNTHQRNVHGSVRKKLKKSRNQLSGFAKKGRLIVRLPKLIRKTHSTSGLPLFNRKNVTARTCDVCQRVFAFRQGMMTHRKVHFEKDGTVRCPKTSRGHVEQAMDGENFKKIHEAKDTHGERQNQYECEKDKSHTLNISTSTYTCKRCNKSFQSRSLLMKHHHASHARNHNLGEKSTPLIQGNGRKYSCDICQQVFQFRFVMLRHRRGHFPEKDGQKGGNDSDDDANSETKHITTGSVDKMTDDKSTFRCGICHEGFSDWSNLLKHRKLHFSKKNNHVENDESSVDSANSKGTDPPSDKSISGGSDSGIDNESDIQITVNEDEKEKTQSQSPMDSDDLTKDGESASNPSTDPGVDNASHEERATPRNESGDVPCDICGKTYSNLFNMQRHSKKVHSKLSYSQRAVNGDYREKVDEMLRLTEATKCLICHAAFTRHGNLMNHVEVVHLNKRHYTCEFCNHKSRYKSTMKIHMQRAHRREGTSQPFQYQATKRKYGRGLNWHAVRGLKKIPERQSRTCPLCSRVFSTKGNMEKHVRQVHGCEPRSIYRKMKLQKDFSEIPDLIKIPVNHSEDPAIKDETQPHFTKKKLPAVDRICGVCRRVFFSRRAMLIHKARAHRGKGTEALVSNPSSDKVEKLKVLDRHHSNFQNNMNQVSEQDRNCDVCAKSFMYRSEMLRHRRFFHPTAKVNAVKNQETENDPPPLSKVPAGLRQDGSDRIKEMLKSDYTGTICTICDKDLSQRSFLVSHVNAVHLKLKPYKCIHCGRAFGFKGNLNSHLKNVHSNDTGNGNETGGDTGASTRTRHGSVDNVEQPTVKVVEKNIECDICKKLFITNFSMIRHKRKHTSDKTLPTRDTSSLHEGKNTQGGNQTLFESKKDKSQISNITASTYNCKKCNKSFTSRSLLVKHHHASHVKRWRYECSKCGKPFMRRDHLQNHMQKIHDDMPLVDDHSKYYDTETDISDGDTSFTSSTTSTMAALPKSSLSPTKIESTKANTQSMTTAEAAVEICESRHRNSSGSSHSSWTPSVASSPSVKSSHSSSSIAKLKLYRCTMCRHIFTNSADWREHLSQHLGGGTKMVHLSSANSDSIKCEDGEETTENTWSYTCPSCKVEIEGSFNLVMHIKGHMRLM